MIDKYSTILGMADMLNSLESDEEIKVFLSKYRKWYINEKNYSKYEAQEQIEKDLKYYARKFIKNEELRQKISNICGFNLA